MIKLLAKLFENNQPVRGAIREDTECDVCGKTIKKGDAAMVHPADGVVCVACQKKGSRENDSESSQDYCLECKKKTTHAVRKGFLKCTVCGCEKPDELGKSDRFNSISEMLAEDIQDETQHAAALVTATESLKQRKNALRPTVAAKRYEFKFIEPGLVKYEDVRNTGHVLVQKDALDKMLPTFIGKPIINMAHAETHPENFREQADGIITEAFYNEKTGWYHARGLVWDRETQDTCDLGINSKKFSVSCAYDPTDGTEEGGDWHNIPYEGEITNGKYTHLAIVPNPRYEKAEIYRLNSKGGNMKLFAWLKGEKKEVDPEATTLVNGKPMKIADLVSKVEEKERQNAGGDLSDETEIEIGGKKTTLGDVKKRLNEKSDDDKKKDDDKDDEEKKKKKDEERQNALNDEKKKEEAEQERLNAKKHFDELEAARHKSVGAVETTIETKEDAVARGKVLFGSPKK